MKALEENRVLFSVYYPHKKINTLAHSSILSILDHLFKENQITSFQYFLSVFKGENMVVYLDMANPEKIKSVKGRIDANVRDFLSTNSPEFKKETLPPRRLFLDLPANSIHFWDNYPFEEMQLFNLEMDEMIHVNTRFNLLCISELAGKSNLNREVLITFFIRVLLIMISMSRKNRNSNIKKILEGSLQKIKEVKFDCIERINEIQKKTLEEYRPQQSYFFNHFQNILQQIESGDFHSAPGIHTEAWVLLFQQFIELNLETGIANLDNFLIDFITILSQKICLQVEPLVSAVSIVNLYCEKNINA